ncbi:HPr-rel-A system PqqD family peptide chaperone [Emcibacter nanhaiensis]|uniref:HPr-rel-A system PqqD family peptide chaperone n=1 Tax=Emcibacter nanhaiensis TaxID=1505037 RepID=A0A501PBS2_9PROT|nr:HPr-rel-A system PqqD family peptide chaperone [Emcibacter nanhaiensis]TPD57314.1 HPr-rel-A system PqqD family peptide chaperone [Emcibacter nanhaiensis]
MSLYETAVFRVGDTAGFLWKNWDDAYVIFDPRSGHTQAMNIFAREILAIIEEKPSTLDQVCNELERVMEEKISEDIRLNIRQTMAEFDKMGLIEPTYGQ